MAKKKEAPKKAAPKKAVKTVSSTKAKAAVKKTSTKPKSSASTKDAVKKVAPKKSAPKKSVTKKVPVKASSKTAVIKDANQLLADAVVEGILEKKGKNISILNLTGIHNRVCDYFIICQADSTTQVNALAGSVQEIVKKLTGENAYRAEGFENSEWILIDYVSVVVHIFQSQVRDFYNLESLWADAEVTHVAFD
jgi:ribosome-associated protein